MSKRERKSLQRNLILKILQKNRKHLSVDEIFRKARKEMPKISLATVYRNLAVLEENKFVMSMSGPDNISLFEFYSKPHHHFICKSCKSIANLESPCVSMCVKCVESHEDAQIESIITTIYGVCKKCLF